MGTSSIQVHRLQPSVLLAAATGAETDADVFERVWAKLPIGAGDWRGHCFLEEEDGLFLKGLEVPMRCSTQMWRRRWDVTREARNLARAGTVQPGSDGPLEVPEIVGWGEETRFGISRRSFLLLKQVRDSVPFNEIANDQSGGLAQSVGADRLGVFREVGRLVRHVHAAGVCHGDLASRNVLLTREGSGSGSGPDARPHAMMIDIPRALWPRTRWRMSVHRRTDLYRITKSAIRQGASEEEARALLDEAAGDEAADVMAKTLLIKAIRQRLKRKARSYWWRWTGT